LPAATLGVLGILGIFTPGILGMPAAAFGFLPLISSSVVTAPYNASFFPAKKDERRFCTSYALDCPGLIGDHAYTTLSGRSSPEDFLLLEYSL
jgi:hypothetical protein